MSKKTIPKALKTAVWLTYVGEKFEMKCTVSWCKTLITPFTFETGHNIPESKGGKTDVSNLRPICGQCNKSMGNRYTIDEFSSVFASKMSKGGKEDRPKKSSFLKKLGNCLLFPNRTSIAPEPTNGQHIAASVMHRQALDSVNTQLTQRAQMYASPSNTNNTQSSVFHSFSSHEGSNDDDKVKVKVKDTAQVQDKNKESQTAESTNVPPIKT